MIGGSREVSHSSEGSGGGQMAAAKGGRQIVQQP